MSRIGQLSALELEPGDVDELEVEADDPSPSAGEVDPELDAELLDSAGPIVIIDPIPLESPVDPALPPQAARPKTATRSEAGCMRRASLARSRALVMSRPEDHLNAAQRRFSHEHGGCRAARRTWR